MVNGGLISHNVHVQLLEYSCKNCTATLIACTIVLSSVRQGALSLSFMTRYCKLLYSMVNAYTRGAVEVLYAGALVVRSRYALDTVLVRSRYARGALPVRFRFGTFR